MASPGMLGDRAPSPERVSMGVSHSVYPLCALPLCPPMKQMSPRHCRATPPQVIGAFRCAQRAVRHVVVERPWPRTRRRHGPVDYSRASTLPQGRVSPQGLTFLCEALLDVSLTPVSCATAHRPRTGRQLCDAIAFDLAGRCCGVDCRAQTCAGVAATISG